MTRIHRGPMTGRTVLVTCATGATGGIGKATASGLAAMGAHVAVTGRDPGRTEAAAREIRAAGQVNVRRRSVWLHGRTLRRRRASRRPAPTRRGRR
jgi:short-subunit dehydrogenase